MSTHRYGQRICLVMIVRNEAHVIRRCLASVRPLVDTWLIVDTGSTDGTQEVIRQALRDLPGALVERPWVDFAHNRNEALALARGRADYVLTIDADEAIELAPDFVLPPLTADSYNVEVLYGGYSYMRKQLVRDALPWAYVGVLHEYIHCPEAATEGVLAGVRTVPRHDGARARDPETYRRDAAVLEKALVSEPDNTRYVFYLAQSYRDAGETELALRHYRRRAVMGGWSEEVWFSLYQIAQLEERLGRPWPDVLHAYLEAWQACPAHAAPLFRIAMHYQAQRQHATSQLFLSRAMRVPPPGGNRLFVEHRLYDYMIAVEYAVAAYYVGDHAAAIATNNALLRSGKLPPEVTDQVIRNRRFSLDARHPRSTGARAGRIRVLIPDGERCEELLESLQHQHDRELDVVRAADAGDAAFDAADVLVPLTARHRLAGPDAVARIRAAFDDPACDLLYAQYRRADGRLGDAEPASCENDFARGPALASAGPLVYRASLHREGSDAARWAAAGFARTRFLDEPLVALVESNPRERALHVETAAAPKISCLMLTRDRLGLAREAIRCFADQTYANRELVIVSQGGDGYRRAIERELGEQRVAAFRIVDAPAGTPLGILRNLSLDAATGDILCQWDDDDCSHPDRLAVQLAEMTRQNARASFFTDHLQFFEHDRTLRWTDWTIDSPMPPEWRLFPGTVMMLRDARFRYPESGPLAHRGEDSAFLGQLIANVPIARIAGRGHLYLYRFHGRNTFEKEHYYGLAAYSTRNDILHARSGVIRDAVDYYRLARPLTVMGREGVAFALG